MSIQKKFNRAIKKNNIELVKSMMNQEDIDPSYDDNIAFIFCCEKGYTEIAKLLMEDERVNSINDFTYCFCIRVACKKGHLNIIKLLLNHKIINPYKHANLFIQVASESNRLDIIKFLLNNERFNPAIKNNYCIQTAFTKKYNKAVHLLWKDQRVKNTLKNDNIILYNELIKKDKLIIKNKLELF